MFGSRFGNSHQVPQQQQQPQLYQQQQQQQINGNMNHNNQMNDQQSRIRMNENDLQRRLEVERQQRNMQSSLPHPQAGMPPPPPTIQVGVAPDNHNDSQFYARQYQNGQPQFQSFQQHPYDPETQQQIQPQIQQQQQQYSENIQENNLHAQPQSQHQRPAPQTSVANQQSKRNSNRDVALERLYVVLTKPNEPNKFTLPDSKCEITSARILNLAIPMMDYNVDEKMSVIQYSVNRLNAESGIWQSVNIVAGSYRSRERLMQAITTPLQEQHKSSEFHYHFHYDSKICSLHAIHAAGDSDKDGLFFNYRHNPRLFRLLGFGMFQGENVERKWESTLYRDNQESSNLNGEAGVQKLNHHEISALYPMNIDPPVPSFLTVTIPELLNWKTSLFTGNTHYGEFKTTELVDDDGIVDLDQTNELGGVVGLNQLTPQISFEDTDFAYHTRGKPIHIAIQLLLRRRS